MLKNYTKMERKQFKFVAMMLFFPLLQFLIFYVYINASSFVLAFTNIEGKFTLDNFKEVLSELKEPSRMNLMNSLIRSVITWAGNLFIVFPVCILFSYALYKKVKGANIFRVLFYMPGMIGSVVMTTMYRYMMDGVLLDVFYKWGWVPKEIYQSGFFYGDVSFKSVFIYGMWIGVGAHLVVLTGALTRIPEEVLESAKLDGVGFFREFFQIALPLIWPTVSTLIVYQLGIIFTADSGTYLLTGVWNDRASTGNYYLFNYVYEMTQSGNMNGAYYPATVGVIITVLTVPFVLIVRHFLEKHTDSVEY